MKREREREDVDGDSKQTEASGAAVVGWVQAGRSGWKPAVKVRLALLCLR